MTHSLFGYTLMAAGACRIVEVCFVLRDKPSGSDDTPPEEGAWYGIHVFQYLCVHRRGIANARPLFLMTASGILFMSATDEEMRWADARGVDHVTWGLIDFSIAFAIFFWSKCVLARAAS